MRIYGMSSNQNNINFGKFIDNNGKEDVKAKEIAQEAVKDGSLNKCDYNILENTDIIHIHSEDDTLQAKINEKALKGIADEYIKILKRWAKPERLANAHEKRKLSALSTGVEAMLEAIHNDSSPKPKHGSNDGPSEEDIRRQQEYDIFFNRAF